MKRPPSSLSAQISAVQRAGGRLEGTEPQPATEGVRLMEQGYLDDAVRTLEWVATHAGELKAFLAGRKAQ